MSSSEREPLGAILPARPDLNRIFQQQVEAGFPPELALDLVLNELVVRAVDATGASSAALALTRGDEMVCRAATGLHAPDLGVPLNTRDGLSGACLHTRQPQVCANTETDPRVDASIARRLGIRSMMIVPVIDGDDLIGILEVFSSEPTAFSEHDQYLLEASARDCARLRRAGEDFERRQPAALEVVSEGEQPSSVETLLAASPMLEAPPPPLPRGKAPYEVWTLVLGALAIVAALAVSFMIGSRIGWLFSSPPAVQFRSLQPPPVKSAKSEVSPAAPARRPASPTPAAAAAAKVQPAPSPDELVIYDRGKVIFRMSPSGKKRSAAPVVDASQSTRITSLPAWLAPEQAQLRVRNRIEPTYPAGALAAHLSGDVVLEVVVAEDGSVASIQTLSGNPVLAAAAADAVRQWRYEPLRDHELPSRFQTDVTVKFSLPSQN